MNLYSYSPLPVAVSQEVSELNSKQIAEELVADLKEIYEWTKENVPMLKDMSPDMRFAHYMDLTSPGDMQLMLLDNYLELVKMGAAPVMENPRWQAIMTIPEIFEDVRADFIHLLKARGLVPA